MKHALRVNLLSFFVSVLLLTTPCAQAQSPHNPNWTRAVVWRPDGTQIALSTQYGSIRILDTDGQVICTLQEENGSAILALDWSPDGLYVANGDSKGQVTIWNVVSGDAIGNYQSPSEVNGLAWHPDSIHLAIASAGGEKAMVWNTVTDETVFQIGLPEAFAVAWKPNGSLLAVGCYGSIQIWDPFTTPAQRITTISATPDLISSLDWSSDGNKLASAQTLAPELSVVNVWVISTNQLLLTYEDHNDVIRTIAWSPDNRYLASASTDGTIRVWDSSTGKTIKIVREETKLLAVDWHPSGTMLAYGTDNGILKLEHVNTDNQFKH